MRTIDNPQFVEEFRPLLNPFDERASYDGFLFGLSGRELQYVQDILAKDPCRIWTYVDSGEDWPVLNSGYSVVNRLGYVITENPSTGFVEVVDNE